MRHIQRRWPVVGHCMNDTKRCSKLSRQSGSGEVTRPSVRITLWPYCSHIIVTCCCWWCCVLFKLANNNNNTDTHYVMTHYRWANKSNSSAKFVVGFACACVEMKAKKWGPLMKNSLRWKIILHHCDVFALIAQTQVSNTVKFTLCLTILTVCVWLIVVI